MTPRDVDAMTNAEFAAFVAFQNRTVRAQERAARQARRGR